METKEESLKKYLSACEAKMPVFDNSNYKERFELDRITLAILRLRMCCRDC